MVDIDLGEEYFSSSIRCLLEVTEQAILPEHRDGIAAFAEQINSEPRGGLQILPLEAVLSNRLNQGAQVVDKSA